MSDASGNRVAKLREERGWKQTELAEKAGISVTYLSEVENNKRSMGSEVLLRVADALGVFLDYIVKGTVATPNPEKPLVIPHELEEIRELQNLSIREIKNFIRFQEFVVARRGEGNEVDSPNQKFSKQEWLNLYEKYKSLTNE